MMINEPRRARRRVGVSTEEERTGLTTPAIVVKALHKMLQVFTTFHLGSNCKQVGNKRKLTWSKRQVWAENTSQGICKGTTTPSPCSTEERQSRRKQNIRPWSETPTHLKYRRRTTTTMTMCASLDIGPLLPGESRPTFYPEVSSEGIEDLRSLVSEVGGLPREHSEKTLTTGDSLRGRKSVGT